jgi:hypothetical protein
LLSVELAKIVQSTSWTDESSLSHTSIFLSEVLLSSKLLYSQLALPSGELTWENWYLELIWKGSCCN